MVAGGAVMSDIVDRLRDRIHDSHMDAERLMDEAQDEIERLRIAMPGWQPIETAPKDRLITGHVPGWRYSREVSWRKDHWECAFAGTMAVDPTLWKELPTPPEVQS